MHPSEQLARECAVVIGQLATGQRDPHDAINEFHRLAYGWIVGDILKNFRLVNREVDAAEIYEDFLEKVYRLAPTISLAILGGAPPRSYLWNIARNCAVDFVKRAKVRMDREEVLEPQYFERLGFAVSPESEFLAQEQTRSLFAALDKLTFEERFLIIAYDLDDRTSTDIANELGIAPRETINRINKAKRKLRRIMKD